MAGFTKKKESPLAKQRRLDNARRVLGFTPNQVITVDTVRSTFAALVKEHHPDGNNEREVGWKHKPNLQMLREAKDMLVKELENSK